MKNPLLPIATVVLLLLMTATVQAQAINWDSVRADYVKKYQPQQMPAWLFPIIFKEGTGQRDTIYLGYDEGAKTWGIGNADTIFGEDWMIIDTTKFNAMWGEGIFNGDSIYKNLIVQNLSASISFYKGHLPLTMYWDREAFYSDSLPFADQSPAPRARGYLWYDQPLDPENVTDCNTDKPIILTDTITAGACYTSDSVKFISFGSGFGFMSLEVVAWKGFNYGVYVEPVKGESAISIYPNPVSNIVNVEIGKPGKYELNIFNIEGQQTMKKVINSDEHFHLHLSGFPSGIYLFEVINAQTGYAYYKKVIKK